MLSVQRVHCFLSFNGKRVRVEHRRIPESNVPTDVVEEHFGRLFGGFT